MGTMGRLLGVSLLRVYALPYAATTRTASVDGLALSLRAAGCVGGGGGGVLSATWVNRRCGGADVPRFMKQGECSGSTPTTVMHLPAPRVAWRGLWSGAARGGRGRGLVEKWAAHGIVPPKSLRIGSICVGFGREQRAGGGSRPRSYLRPSASAGRRGKPQTVVPPGKRMDGRGCRRHTNPSDGSGVPHAACAPRPCTTAGEHETMSMAMAIVVARNHAGVDWYTLEL